MQLNLIYGKQNKCCHFATGQNKYNGTGIIISHMELAKSFAGFVHEMQA